MFVANLQLSEAFKVHGAIPRLLVLVTIIDWPLAEIRGILPPQPVVKTIETTTPPLMPMEAGEVRLETERLVLRRLVPEDFSALFAMSGSPEMWRFPLREPMSSEEAWNLLLRHEGHWGLAGYGVFAILEKTTGRFAGLAGTSRFQRDLGPDFDPHPEMTWSVIPGAQGQGYGTEAAAAALAWFDAAFAAPVTTCLIHADNEPSLRVAAKLGFAEFRRQRYKDYPAILLRREA